MEAGLWKCHVGVGSSFGTLAVSAPGQRHAETRDLDFPKHGLTAGIEGAAFTPLVNDVDAILYYQR